MRVKILRQKHVIFIYVYICVEYVLDAGIYQIYTAPSIYEQMLNANFGDDHFVSGKNESIRNKWKIEHLLQQLLNIIRQCNNDRMLKSGRYTTYMERSSVFCVMALVHDVIYNIYTGFRLQLATEMPVYYYI